MLLSQHKNHKDGYINIFIIILFIAVSGFLFWSFNKGIDLRDEGLSFGFAQPSVDNFSALINYDLFFKLIYKTIGLKFGIVGLRWLNYLLIISLFIPLYILFNNKKNYKLSFILFVSFAFLSVYAFASKTINYYSLTFYFAFLFYFLTEILMDITSRLKQCLIFLLLGIISSLSFFVKPPLGLVLIIISGFLVFFKFKKNTVFINFISVFLGFSFIQYFFFLLFNHYSFFTVLSNSFELTNTYPAYSNSMLLRRMLAAFKWIILLLFSGISIGFALKKNGKILKSVFLIGISGIIVYYFFISHSSSNEFSVSQYFLSVITLMTIGYISSEYSFSNFSISNLFICSFLLVLPLICSFGSGVYFFRLAQEYIIFWWILIVYLFHHSRFFFNPAYIFIFLSSYLAYRVIDNHILNPFNQPSLTSNFIPYKYNEGKTIYLDSATHVYLSEISRKLSYYNVMKKDIFGLHAFPGDILLANQNIAYNPMIWDDFQYKFYTSKMNKKSYNNSLYLIRDDLMKNYTQFNVLDSVNYRGNNVYIAANNQ